MTLTPAKAANYLDGQKVVNGHLEGEASGVPELRAVLGDLGAGAELGVRAVLDLQLVRVAWTEACESDQF